MASARPLLVVLVCVALLGACGDDSSTSSDSGGDSGTDGAMQMSTPTPDAGPSNTGADQGEICRVDDDCKGSLTCVAGPPGPRGTPRHCARACADDSECVGDLDEQCITYSGSAADFHCASITDVPFSACGVADNVACEPPMTCLPPGVCIEICEFDAEEDAGVDADADAGVGQGSCSRETDSCVEGILTGTDFGACATFIDRGEVCGGESGMCSLEDLCAPDPLQPLAQSRCIQRCGEAGIVCEDGTDCTVIGTFTDGSDASVCQ